MVLEPLRLTADERRGAILRPAGTCLPAGASGARHGRNAAGAGCSEPTLYKYFPSKQALFAAVLDDATEAMRARSDELVAGRPARWRRCSRWPRGPRATS